jgi:hypothetical protein
MNKKLIILLLILSIIPGVVYASVCGDWTWENNEWCGQDCYHDTPNNTDMNHDCVVDPIDLVLIAEMFGGTNPSGDLNGDGKVDMRDMAIFGKHYGNTSVSPCTVTTTYTVQDVGNLMISFSSNPSNIINNISIITGTTFRAYIVADKITDMRSLEFGLTSSPNLQYQGFTGNLSGVGFTTENSIEVISNKNISGPVIVGWAEYKANSIGPATINITTNSNFGKLDWHKHANSLYKGNFNNITNGSVSITVIPGLDIMISEIYYNTSNDLQDQYIELYVWDDGGLGNVNISGWYVTTYDGDNEILPYITGLGKFDYIVIHMGSGINDLDASDGNATIYLNRISPMLDYPGDEVGLYDSQGVIYDFVRYGGGNGDSVQENWPVSDPGIVANNINESIQILGADLDDSSNWISSPISENEPNIFEWIIDDETGLRFQIQDGVNYPINLTGSPWEDPGFDIVSEGRPLSKEEIGNISEYLNFSYKHYKKYGFGEPQTGANGKVRVRVTKGNARGGNADDGSEIAVNLSEFDSLKNRTLNKKTIEHELMHSFQHKQAGGWGPMIDWADIEALSEYWSINVTMQEFNISYEDYIKFWTEVYNRNPEDWLKNTDRNVFSGFKQEWDYYWAAHMFYRWIAEHYGDQKLVHIHRVRNASAGITGIKAINKAFEEEGKTERFEDLYREWLIDLWKKYKDNITLTENITYNGGKIIENDKLMPWGTDFEVKWINTTSPFNITFKGKICQNYSITVIKVKDGTEEIETHRIHSNGTITIGKNYKKIVLIKSQLGGTENTSYELTIENVTLPSLEVVPKIYTADHINETFNINIDIKDLLEEWNLIGAELKLGYNSSLLEVESVTEGPFLQSFAPYGTWFMSDNEIGYAHVGNLIYPNPNGTWNPPFPHGDGTIATIAFKVINSGESILDLYDTNLVDTNSVKIPHYSSDGYFKFIQIAPVITIYSPINNTSYYKTYIPLNFTINKPTSWIGYSLNNTKNKTISGPINLTGLADKWNNVTVFANDSSGNMGKSETVYFFYCLGDIISDKKIDARDVALVASLFGAKCGDTKYNPNADLNDDCKIDARDVALVASLYGKKCS